jgi:hypothetical protein
MKFILQVVRNWFDIIQITRNWFYKVQQQETNSIESRWQEIDYSYILLQIGNALQILES